MSDYVFRLSPPVQNSPHTSEAQLLEVLRELREKGQLSGREVHVYERVSMGRTHKGTIDASSVLMSRGVDLARVEETDE